MNHLNFLFCVRAPLVLSATLLHALPIACGPPIESLLYVIDYAMLEKNLR